MPNNSKRLTAAYHYLVEKSLSKENFTLEEMSEATGLSPVSVGTYCRKHWTEFTEKLAKGVYRALEDIQELPLDVFMRLNSQKVLTNKDPFKPIVTRTTESLINKSREAALLAVQIYNNPTMSFRTPSFAVHMVIAFTSLFHAIFEERGIEYVHRDASGELVLHQGKPKFWELNRCILQHWGDQNDPVKDNLKLFIEVRNEVEHRYAPAFDNKISAECQALLINYERMLVQEFSPYYALGAHVAVPLQLSKVSNKSRITALRELQKDDYKYLKDILDTYRASLSDESFLSHEYAFRVFLVPMAVNRKESSDTVMEFINPSSLSREDLSALQTQITLIKTRQVEVANKNTYKPSQVVQAIQEQVEPRFRLHEHTLAWKHYQVRPVDKRAEGCNNKYCLFDIPHQDFVYTAAWIDFLKDQLKDDESYEGLVERWKNPMLRKNVQNT